jgi:hypothetical protein
MESSVRNADGTFREGHKFGKGNPLTKRLYDMRVRLYARVSDDDFNDIVDNLVSLAKQGDVAAAKLLIEHLCGKPVQAVTVSGPDGERLGITLADIQVIIVEALADNPDARQKVVDKLRALHGSAARIGQPD